MADDQVKKCKSMRVLVEHMNNAGITGGLVCKTYKDATIANTSLTADINRLRDMPEEKKSLKDAQSNIISLKDRYKEKVKGVWFILPSCTNEIPAPVDLPDAMKKHNIAAMTVNPLMHRYIPRKFVIGDYMEMAQELKIPVLFNTVRGITLEQIDDLLKDFPDLTTILTYAQCWPNDRLLRPFLDEYPNLHLDMTYILTDSWLKEMLIKYPAEKILFGSGFPISYMSANMMVIKHAEIKWEDKIKIAGKNLINLINWKTV